MIKRPGITEAQMITELAQDLYTGLREILTDIQDPVDRRVQLAKAQVRIESWKDIQGNDYTPRVKREVYLLSQKNPLV